ncbi:MAG: AAA family ATPase [Acidobacteria bacterium]|nr:AAA family ATPase [Acidobacteriota bacterium]
MTLHTGSSFLPSWAQDARAKVAIPELPDGHVPRESLVRQLASLLERRLTVLLAPAGCGKTMLLADVCRAKRQEAVVAWLALDAGDRPGELAAYLAVALGRAGMDLAVLQECGRWSSLRSAQQMGLLARAVELHAAPCLLVLDNIDRLHSASADWLDRLVKRGPRNLHVAVACRSTPRINLTGPEIDGAVSIIGAKQLRRSTTSPE